MRKSFMLQANSQQCSKTEGGDREDSDKESNEKQQPQSAVVVYSVPGNRLHARRFTIAARLEDMLVDNDEDKTTNL
ncbi:hypothetical protein ACLKA6_000908 [Drosophila palustris]